MQIHVRPQIGQTLVTLQNTSLFPLSHHYFNLLSKVLSMCKTLMHLRAQMWDAGDTMILDAGADATCFKHLAQQ
jgi:hypothetical protein